MDRVNQKLDQKTFFESMPKVKLCPKNVLLTNFVFPCRPLTRSPSEYGEKEAVTAGGGRDDREAFVGLAVAA